MKKLSVLIDRRKSSIKKYRSAERGDLLEYFAAEANRERKGKYKPLPLRFYAVKLSHLSVKDLYYLKSISEDAQRRGGIWAK